MTEGGKSIKSYFRETNTLLYSYLISLPLLLLYEILIFISQPDASSAVRISVDVWIKTLFSYFGNNVISITLILVALLGIVILYRERNRLSTLKPAWFLGMLAEAFVYAFGLALLLSVVVGALVQIVQPETISSLSAIQKIALSLGAGLYEELFFRVLLVSGLLYLFNYLMKKKGIAFAAAIVTAALIFSFVHYIGAFGDPFTMGSFIFRFLFGLALNAIYIWRGFGMAAWTHAIYDIMVVVYG
jgi:membrane protease YdiL (CAAX protease family)